MGAGGGSEWWQKAGEWWAETEGCQQMGEGNLLGMAGYSGGVRVGMRVNGERRIAWRLLLFDHARGIGSMDS